MFGFGEAASSASTAISVAPTKALTLRIGGSITVNVVSPIWGAADWVAVADTMVDPSLDFMTITTSNATLAAGAGAVIPVKLTPFATTISFSA